MNYVVLNGNVPAGQPSKIIVEVATASEALQIEDLLRASDVDEDNDYYSCSREDYDRIAATYIALA